ncbi:hypothetical protein [Anthocerotibacter panamensis]|uniref:hypothetical protein n=1 Tax=Anthocerotibacter panamensis TaxID=2857077 RepID=UPI001C40378A|nr:hypothetical protein [Anthocerotibacter panamensis]
MKKIHFGICIFILVISANLDCDSATLLKANKSSIPVEKINTLSPEIVIARGGKKKMELSKKIQSPDKKATVIFSQPIKDPGVGTFWKQAEIIYNNGKVASKYTIRPSQDAEELKYAGFDINDTDF